MNWASDCIEFQLEKMGEFIALVYFQKWGMVFQVCFLIIYNQLFNFQLKPFNTRPIHFVETGIPSNIDRNDIETAFQIQKWKTECIKKLWILKLDSNIIFSNKAKKINRIEIVGRTTSTDFLDINRNELFQLPNRYSYIITDSLELALISKYIIQLDSIYAKADSSLDDKRGMYPIENTYLKMAGNLFYQDGTKRTLDFSCSQKIVLDSRFMIDSTFQFHSQHRIPSLYSIYAQYLPYSEIYDWQNLDKYISEGFHLVLDSNYYFLPDKKTDFSFRRNHTFYRSDK